MRKAAVYRNGILAGELIEESRNRYVFRYDPDYYANPEMPAISLSFPKTTREYHDDSLFPFFSNMLAEGANLAIQERYLKIDRDDTFRLLGTTAGNDTIGAVTVELIDHP